MQRLMRLFLVVFVALGAAACVAQPGPMETPSPIATQEIVTTRLAADLPDAELTLDNGCLRAGRYVLVWPPEFSVTLTGDRVEVVDGLTGDTAAWRLGDKVSLGGGVIRRENIDAQAGQRWYGTCEGANEYWLVGDISFSLRETAAAPAMHAIAVSPRPPPLPSAAYPNPGGPQSAPTITPDFSYVPNCVAGAGLIISDSTGLPGWPLAVANVWYQRETGVQVLAGVTAEANQGAVAVLTPRMDPVYPELYLTPRRAGMVQVMDAQGERLVLRSLDERATFYFDLPTRRFVDSLTVTETAPTVTPLPTLTPTPTLAPILPSETPGPHL